MPIRRPSLLLALVLGGLLPAATAPAWAAVTPRRVLMVHSFGREVAPYSIGASTFRTTLARDLGVPVDFSEVSLDLTRFDDPESLDALAGFLESRLSARPVDLVVAIGGPAVNFVGKNRDRLFPKTPALFLGADPRGFPGAYLREDTAHVVQKIDVSGMLEEILRLRPDTRQIEVVIGASALERFWEKELRRELAPYAGRVRVDFLSDLPLEKIVRRCAALPPRSFILYAIFLEDADGVPYDNDEALTRLHASASAPIYGYFGSTLGKGAVGGHLYRDVDVGAQGAQAAIRILRGTSPWRTSAQLRPLLEPVWDWRELQRWGIDEERLPPGSVVRFRRPTVWERYWPWIVGAFAVCVLQATLILGLLANRSSRLQAEKTLRDFSRNLIRSQERARASLARELHDDVTQRLARLAIDVGLVELNAKEGSPVAAMRPLREELILLGNDVRSLSHRLHSSVLEDLGLAEALRTEADRFSKQEAVPADVRIGELPPTLPPEPALCLFRVAQEALRNVARHAGARRVEISMRAFDGGLELAIHDDGVGFTPDLRKHRRTLGLTSMRERIQLLEGALDIDSGPGRGTTVLAWVPLKGASE